VPGLIPAYAPSSLLGDSVGDLIDGRSRIETIIRKAREGNGVSDLADPDDRAAPPFEGETAVAREGNSRTTNTEVPRSRRDADLLEPCGHRVVLDRSDIPGSARRISARIGIVGRHAGPCRGAAAGHAWTVYGNERVAVGGIAWPGIPAGLKRRYQKIGRRSHDRVSGRERQITIRVRVELQGNVLINRLARRVNHRNPRRNDGIARAGKRRILKPRSGRAAGLRKSSGRERGGEEDSACGRQQHDSYCMALLVL
jgi:hypothetical protein